MEIFVKLIVSYVFPFGKAFLETFEIFLYIREFRNKFSLLRIVSKQDIRTPKGIFFFPVLAIIVFLFKCQALLNIIIKKN